MSSSTNPNLTHTVLLDAAFRLPLVVTVGMLALSLGMLLTAALVG